MRLVLLAVVLAVLSASAFSPVSAAPVPERDEAVTEQPVAPAEKKPLGHLTEFTDVEAYKFLVLTARVPRRSPADYRPEPWRDTAIGNIVAWTEFIER